MILPDFHCYENFEVLRSFRTLFNKKISVVKNYFMGESLQHAWIGRYENTLSVKRSVWKVRNEKTSGC